ncbi:MAG: hypothetical protein ACLTF6_10255 [Clostridium sp.]
MIMKAAAEGGYTVPRRNQYADDAGDRPGMKALQELQVMQISR